MIHNISHICVTIPFPPVGLFSSKIYAWKANWLVIYKGGVEL